jgi:hypothetical protein
MLSSYSAPVHTLVLQGRTSVSLSSLCSEGQGAIASRAFRFSAYQYLHPVQRNAV